VSGPGQPDVERDFDVEEDFPALAGGHAYRKTSDQTLDYNCLAWAFGDTTKWWDPSKRVAGYWWFPGVDREWTIEAITKILVIHSYKNADHNEYEEGFEKICFYLDEDKVPTHFARQLKSGKWTSKIGSLSDIEHDTLESLEGDLYGRAMLTFKRARPEWEHE